VSRFRFIAQVANLGQTLITSLRQLEQQDIEPFIFVYPPKALAKVIMNRGYYGGRRWCEERFEQESSRRRLDQGDRRG